MNYDLLLSMKKDRHPKDFLRSMGRFLAFSMSRISRRRALLKDPISIFSAEWLHSTFNMDVIVMIRHPAAFASSVKLLNLNHPFDHFLSQPLLMQEHLEADRAEIEAFSKKEYDLVDQAALLWRLIYRVVLKYQARHPGWLFIRHEDISRSPEKSFENIFQRLDLPFDHHSKTSIIRHSFSKAPKSGDYSGNAIRRKSLENIDLWKKRLSAREVHRIRRRVDEIASRFYSEKEW